MTGHSKLTTVVGIRLPNSVVETIRKRCQQNHRYTTISSYLRMRIIYDITRTHIKHSDNAKRGDSKSFSKNADTLLAHK